MRIAVSVACWYAAATITPFRLRALVRSAVIVSRKRVTAVTLSVAFVDEVESRRVNRHFRGKRKAANVLSIALDPEHGVRTERSGEIVLCPAAIGREARRAKVSEREHTERLFLHGMLHLLGYDHRTAAAEASMERMTTRALTNT